MRNPAVTNHNPTKLTKVWFATVFTIVILMALTVTTSCAGTQLAGDVPSTMDPPVAKLVMSINGEEAGSCTVFKVVGTDLAMTAGHCCDPSTKEETIMYHAVGPHAVPGASFEVLHDDDAHDVCVMRGKMKGAPLHLALHDPTVGARVWTAGYPKTVFLISEGLWSGRDPDGEAMASIAVWGGASGSPVMDNEGRVVGVLRAFYPPMSNMAVIAPIEWLRAGMLTAKRAK
jgi:hypothetical protein